MALAAPFPAVSPSRAPRAPRPTAPASGLRLTRRGRVVLGLAVALLVVGFALVTGAFRAEATADQPLTIPATGVVVVQPGESLWQIAKAVAPEADPRETVTRIRDLNGLGQAPIVAGQSLVVPLVASAG